VVAERPLLGRRGDDCPDLGLFLLGLITTRILVQLIAQIAAVTLIRKRADRPFAFRMPLYPLPSLVALVGWVFIFATSGIWYILGGLGTMAVGPAAYFVWSWQQTRSQETE